jgi:gentisate 1,2-dioxygenase
LRNPRPRFEGDRAAVGNITAALQILKPGESARPHRHTMNALRFVLSGSGASTIVDGKDCPMEEGDLITTPGWTWHEHVHRGTAPVVWLDALDVPLHAFMGTGMFEPGPVHDAVPTPPDDVFTHASLVPDGVEGGTPYSPVFRHRWADVVHALGAAPRGRDGARRVRYVNPLTGGPVLAMLDCFAVELDGEETRPFRTTSNAVCVALEGEGVTHAGDEVVSWGARDVFSLPGGTWIRHRARDRARLFMVTDRDVLRRLDLLRDEYAENLGRDAL